MLLLAKPVNRPIFVLGKILGILAGLTIFCFLCSVSTLIAIRVAKDQFWIDNKGLFTFFGAIVSAGFTSTSPGARSSWPRCWP